MHVGGSSCYHNTQLYVDKLLRVIGIGGDVCLCPFSLSHQYEDGIRRCINLNGGRVTRVVSWPVFTTLRIPLAISEVPSLLPAKVPEKIS